MHAWVHPCIHAWVHPCIHSSMHGCIHASMHLCMDAWMHGCIYESMAHGAAADSMPYFRRWPCWGCRYLRPGMSRRRPLCAPPPPHSPRIHSPCRCFPLAPPHPSSPARSCPMVDCCVIFFVNCCMAWMTRSPQTCSLPPLLSLSLRVDLNAKGHLLSASSPVCDLWHSRARALGFFVARQLVRIVVVRRADENWASELSRPIGRVLRRHTFPVGTL